MPGPTFRELYAVARAHQKPEFDAPDLAVNNARSAEEFAPSDWTEDALRSVPRSLPLVRSPADGRYIEPRVPPAPPHVFQGPMGAIEGYPEDGRNAWRASDDAAIVAAVNRHNAERNLYPGDAEFMTPQLIKSWMMEESGSASDRAAFGRDPFQVNNPGDYTERSGEKSRIAGLRKDQVMTPESSADAALKWPAYKARLHRDGGGRLGPYWTPFEVLRNYNGNVRDYEGPDAMYRGMRHHDAYANRILSRVRK
jgi:hypothetical protein